MSGIHWPNLNRQSDSPSHGSSCLLFFARNPFPNVRRTVTKRDAVAFALSEEPNSLSIDEDNILEIQHQRSARGFFGKERRQFADVVRSQPTAQGEDNVAIGYALDLQHVVLAPEVSNREAKARR
jgi:hypothetical protein